MNFSKVMEWYLQQISDMQDQQTTDMIIVTVFKVCAKTLFTHSEAMKLHSEEERGTYSAIREVTANT